MRQAIAEIERLITYDERWKKVVECLKAGVSPDEYNNWLHSLRFERLDGKVAVVSVPTRFLRNWVVKHYAEILFACVKQVMPEAERVHINVRSPAIRPYKDAVNVVVELWPFAVDYSHEPPIQYDLHSSEFDVFGPLIQPFKASRRPKVEDIQRAVARQYNIARADILSHKRTANMRRPRQIAMYLARKLTLRSFPDIGRRFGGYNHTTVLHAVRRVEGLIGNDQCLAEEIDALEMQLEHV